MRKHKGKPPGRFHYVKDHLTDAALQKSRSATRGIWGNMIDLMWLENEQGKLSVPREDFPRLLNCTLTERDNFLTDAMTHRFCDVEESPDGIITVVCRRMHREWKSSTAHKMRQRRYEKSLKEDARPDAPVPCPDAASDAPPDGDMTPPSSYSSSFASSFASSTSTSEDLKSVLRSTFSPPTPQTQDEKRFGEAPPEENENPSPTPQHQDERRFVQAPPTEEERMEATLCDKANRILLKLYGPGYFDNQEARDFTPLVLKLTGLIGQGRVSLDRVLAAAKDASDGYNAGTVKKRGPWFSHRVEGLLSENTQRFTALAARLSADR